MTMDQQLAMLRPVARGFLHALWIVVVAPVVCWWRDHQWDDLWECFEDDRLSMVGFRCARCRRATVVFCATQEDDRE